MRSEEAEKTRVKKSGLGVEEEEGRLEMKQWRKSKGVTECNLQLRMDKTRSSIRWTVLGSNTNLGSNTCSSNRNGTSGSSIFAANDKHATDSS
jgi:hypothetical protein